MLFQVASSVTQAIGGGTLDTVQPIHLGWYIYMHSTADCEILIQRGLVVAGQYVTLRLEVTPKQYDTAKVMLKDLPLHSVSNEEVLEAVKQLCPIQSEVKYSNI